jgi:hypothetical protein
MEFLNGIEGDRIIFWIENTQKPRSDISKGIMRTVPEKEEVR